MSEPVRKRKKVVLTIEQKLQVRVLVKKGMSYATTAEGFGIGRSTNSDIKRSKADPSTFSVQVQVGSLLYAQCCTHCT